MRWVSWIDRKSERIVSARTHDIRCVELSRQEFFFSNFSDIFHSHLKPIVWLTSSTSELCRKLQLLLLLLHRQIKINSGQDANGCFRLCSSCSVNKPICISLWTPRRNNFDVVGTKWQMWDEFISNSFRSDVCELSPILRKIVNQRITLHYFRSCRS